MIITENEVADLSVHEWRSPELAAALYRLTDEGVTARQIADYEGLTVYDRRWFLTHLLARGPRPSLRGLVAWACGCAFDVVDLVAQEGEVRHALEAAVRWSAGEEIMRRDIAAAIQEFDDPLAPLFAWATSAPAACQSALVTAMHAIEHDLGRAADEAARAARYAAEARNDAWAEQSTALGQLRELAAILDATP
jgi:hypothetical protein